MSRSFDHDRVSELLPEFLDGSLGEADASAIEEHLEGCEGCRSEAAALTALRTPVEPLTSSERLALEHRVMAGIAEDSPAPAPVTEIASRRGTGARVAQALGAAAVVAVIGTFFYLSIGSGGSDDSAETADLGVAQEDGEGSGGDRRENKARSSADAAGAPNASDVQAATEADAGTTGGGGGSGTSFKAPPEPRFVVADDPYTSAELQKLGESSLASVRFANYYSPDDSDGRITLLEQLVASAEDVSGAEVADQVDECGNQVLDTEDPTIPTFGVLGELDGDPVLILGFAWSRESSGTLDRYMVWAWEEGSCSTAVDFIEGRIETAG